MSAPGLRLNTAADHAAARAAQDKRNYGRKWGRAFRGERTTTRAVFVRGKRFSLVPVLSYYGLLDWYIVEGGLDAARFRDLCSAVWHVTPRRLLARARAHRLALRCHSCSRTHRRTPWWSWTTS